MTVKVGVNGFGRIGRQVLKAIIQSHKNTLEVVVVNDLTDTKTNAHLFKYDSNYGIYPGKVDHTSDSIVIDGKPVKVIAERDPSKIPWKDYGA
ncbi:MAG: type I glyceraldehyde-3-phosphate dehydrogenase, partial [Chloroflexi bacterium]|nr:type I glyceraldehyde-3-phosphate dehydrogenase [Chloroflexota bacterium]